MDRTAPARAYNIRKAADALSASVPRFWVKSIHPWSCRRQGGEEGRMREDFFHLQTGKRMVNLQRKIETTWRIEGKTAEWQCGAEEVSIQDCSQQLQLHFCKLLAHLVPRKAC